jgi:hypothetical protein
MSDSYGGEPAADAPAEADASAPESSTLGGESTDQAPAAPPEYLPVDDYAGHHVRLRVDGEDIEVPLSEALQGYSRQADYTRKTQQLAEQQREAQFAITLQKALENNPEATLRLLQEQYGVAVPQPTAGDSDDEDWLADPTEARFKEYDQRLQAAEQFRADQELQVALRVLQQQFGDDFDPQAVVSTAMQTGRMDLANIHKEMMFDKFWSQQQAQQEAERRRQTDESQRTAAKAGVAAHIGGGASSAAETPETGTATSVADAYMQAKRTLGL